MGVKGRSEEGEGSGMGTKGGEKTVGRRHVWGTLE